MKKFLIGLFAIGLVFAFTMPVYAFDSDFGGYWRTRAYKDRDFNGTDTGARDVTQTDMRTRLYYTAVFSDNFKFVNKFEYNVTWGDTVGGDIGADGMGIFRIKNSYADFNLASFNFKVGIQGGEIHRGFFFSDDFSGVVATYKGDGISVPFMWIKAYEGGMGDEANDNDFDYYVVAPSFKVGDAMTLKPTLVYMYSKDANKWASTAGFDTVKIYNIGLDADVKLDMGSLWFTGIYQGGDVEMPVTGDTIDASAWLVALGGTVKAGAADIHGQVFYATGDDADTDDEFEAFYVPRGRSYYWSEIMGFGVFDNQVSSGSCADQISNIMAANIGVGFKASADLKISADLWYAKLVEKDANDEDALGTEIDLKVTYKVLENLNLDIIAAYLFAGEATYDGDDSENPMELGTRLSFSF
ncbi:MAG: alginate export family protein [Deltaproteobacteria bacterium]|nr:alginate export family protein [Deltaproteobacteria bacterium]